MFGFGFGYSGLGYNLQTEIMGQQVIAIDGPAASGKSSVARAIAIKLNIPYINTGNLYRAVALAASRANIEQASLAAETAIANLLKTTRLSYVRNITGEYAIKLNDEFPGSALRTPEIAEAASALSTLPCVRKWLLDKQRSFAEHGLIVMEGRDIGTVIFPDADLKFFLTAAPEERARRRLAQTGEAAEDATIESVAREIAERDKRDSSRPIAPLKPADDAIVVDTSGMTIDEVVEQILQRCNTIL